MLGIIAVTSKEPIWVFIYICIAMFINGTDGLLARGWEVKRWATTIDGRKLDDTIDFRTYAFIIPIYFFYQFEIMSGPWIAVLFVALLAAAHGFYNESAKTRMGFSLDFHLIGVELLYLYWLALPIWLAGIAILILAILTFVPAKYISQPNDPLAPVKPDFIHSLDNFMVCYHL